MSADPAPALAPDAELDGDPGDTEVRAVGLRDPDWGASETIRHGWRASPELREGAWITVLLAFIGAGGRIVVPILIQQSIDKGYVNGSVDIGVIVRLAVIAAVAIVVAGFANRAAVARLADQERARPVRPAHPRLHAHPPALDRRPRRGAPRRARGVG